MYPQTDDNEDSSTINIGNFSLFTLDEFTVSSDNIEVMPNGRHIGSIIDMWNATAINHQIELGGLAHLDYPRYGLHGRSWTQQNWTVNGRNITDPFITGIPIVEVPWLMWSEVSMPSILVSAADKGGYGIRYNVDEPDPGIHTDLQTSSTFNIGGPLLLPDYAMEREPGFSWGASEDDRRTFNSCYELQSKVSLNNGDNSSLIFALDYIYHDRSFPVNDLINEIEVYDEISQYANAGFMYNFEIDDVGFEILTLLDYTLRNDLGIEGWQADHTVCSNSLGFHTSIKADIPLMLGSMEVIAGLSGKYEDRTPNSDPDTPYQFDFIQEQNIRYKSPEAGEGYRLLPQLKATWKNNFSGIDFVCGAEYQAKIISWMPDIPGDAEEWKALHWDGEWYPLYVLYYNTQKEMQEFIHQLLLWAQMKSRWGIFELDSLFGMDISKAGTRQERSLLSYASPILRINSNMYFSRDKIILAVGYLHSPEAITYYQTRFLDTNSPSGYKYDWEDDGNQSVDPGEEGMLLQRTGGLYHEVDENIKRPQMEEVYAGVQMNFWKIFTINFQTNFRVYRNTYTVEYDEETAASFYPQVADTYGRIVFNRDVSSFGEETYYLTNYNGENPAIYQGVELQFMLLPESGRGFLNIQLIAFWALGSTPFGIGPDYNDLGMLDESQADPNYQTSAYGRLDSDRAYGVVITGGVVIIEGLTLSTALRYRDGEPFSLTTYYYQGNQGHIKASGEPSGKSRLTFAMNWDIKIRYEININKHFLGLSLTLFNILGSATETGEYTYFGSLYRSSIDTVPPRMLEVMLDWEF